MQIIRLIEDAILDAITRTLIRINVRTVDLYSGQLSSGDIADITFRFPCVYVIAGGIRFEDRNKVRVGTIGCSLYVGDMNLRGDSQAKRGDAGSPGVYQIVETLYGLIHGETLGSGTTPQKVTGVSPLVYEPDSGLCVYELTTECYWLSTSG